MFNELDYIPDGLLDAGPEQLLDLLGAPTLIHLNGERPEPLFVSTLLHGNETTGFETIRRILTQYSERKLPRSLSVFIGNVAAAAEFVRRLDDQADYNRVWPGTNHPDCTETDMMRTVTHIMRRRKPFASIDIHNNTGRNPHYACVNILNAHCMQLAGLFGNTVVYFTSPRGVQSAAFSEFCPAVVLECGQSGQADGVTHSARLVDTVLNMDSFETSYPQSTSLYHTVARVTIPEMYTFGRTEDRDIMLDESLEMKNFHELEAGTPFARVADAVSGEIPFLVHNESNENVTGEFFDLDNGRVMLKRSATLSMYTVNERAVRQDCLCYLMEQLRIG